MTYKAVPLFELPEDKASAVTPKATTQVASTPCTDAPSIAPTIVSTIKVIPTNLAEAWELWLTLPRAGGEGVNAERSQSDIANHRRALELVALGSREVEDLTQVPMADLAFEVDIVRERLYEGAKLQALRTKRAEPASKTLSNLASNLMRLRNDLKDVLSLPAFAPKSGRQLRRELPRRKSREHLSHDAWPQSLLDDWNAYQTYCTEPFYAGVGKEYRGKAIREVSVKAHKTRIGQLVRYCLAEESIDNITFEHLVDIDRIHRFRAWYFGNSTEGGYDGFKYCCVTVGLFAKYLCATGRAFTDFTPDSNSAKAPWKILYTLGRTTKNEGAGKGKLVQKTRIPPMTPHDLMALANNAWSTPPRINDNNGTRAIAAFNRKRAAVFFALAPFMPVRRRNWIDMKWRKNLYQQRDGTWVVSFKGEELKVGQRKGEVNVYEHELPPIAGVWIEKWRAYLEEQIGPDFEKKAPYVLPARNRKRQVDGSITWDRSNHNILPNSIGNTCLELRGHDFPMHQIRHIMATNLINSSTSLEGAQVAADLLGDKLETVLSTYYRPNRDALRKAYFEKLQEEFGFKD